MNKKRRDKKVRRLVKLTVSSLESHLPFLTKHDKHFGSLKKSRKFHALCVKEYAEMLTIISEIW